jgi:SAM-dependent methyltransferase
MDSTQPKTEYLEGKLAFTPDAVKRLSEMPMLDNQVPWALLNPWKHLQETFVGLSFDAAYAEAAEFLNFAFRFFEPHPGDPSRVLDFGCGWGRMLRIIRSTPAFSEIDLYGCDPVDVVLQVCQRTVPKVSVSRVDLYPPTPYRSALFDFIYAYSVFSHLSPECHLSCAQEFARILKPGGIVCVTTRPKRHLAICAEVRSRGLENLGSHELALAQSFADPNAGAKYDAGEFLYEPSGGGFNLIPSAYGEAIVPRAFFERTWIPLGFELVEWDEGPDIVGGQSRVVFRRRQ